MTILISFFLLFFVFFNFKKKQKLDFINFFFYFYSIPRILTPNRRIRNLIPRIPTPIPRIPTLIPGIPTLIPRVFIISLVPFPDSLFRFLQIAEVWK